MNTKGLFFFTLVLLFMAFLLTGCTRDKITDKKISKVRLSEVVHSVFYAPMYVALSKGFFTEEGLAIELSTGQGADKVMTALVSNSADIGLAGPEASIYVFNQGRDDYAMNFAQLTKRDGSFLVGRLPEPNFKWENIKGKTIIGGRPGGVPEMVLEYILKSHGLTPGKDVNVITNLQFTATAGAFKGGIGDYVALFEPTASMLEKEKAGFVIASIGKASGEVPYTVFMARKNYIADNPIVVQCFTNAIYKAQIWVNNQSSKEIAKAILPFFPATDIDILTRVVERYKTEDAWDINPILEDEALVHLEEIIQSAGELNNKINPNLLITRTFAQKAIENLH